MLSEIQGLPIRELSRLTGVNSITLRAWERRYGLLKPQRTAKGHRLFQAQDIERVKNILYWLQRGISVGQVREYIDREHLPDVAPIWQEHIQQFQRWLNTLNISALDNACQALFALYPEAVLAEHFFRPLLRSCQPRQYEHALLQQLLIGKLQLRLLNQRPSNSAACILVLNIDHICSPLHALLLSLLLQQQGYACKTIGLPCHSADIPALLSSSQANALLLTCDTAIDTEFLHSLNLPVFIYGDATALNPALQSYALSADYNQAITTISGEIK
ncbi:MAG: MerR family transcriptional regulator [Oceanospirillaceae bacterium]|nr:MerR family transcriptional regulator [Oceanospirillaceae bacterium]MCP5335496.1 MerR family transcriptional regulator [Oceanospirillaceae bacterium]MCP5349967.1 MerR family transcriptional regulator [Oceanospirillaceae bacterium]